MDYSLESVQKLFDRYNITKDTNENFVVVERGTNLAYDDSNFCEKVKFAHTWYAATKYERSSETENPKIITQEDYYNYAFSPKAKEVYNSIMALVSNNIVATGVLMNPQTLENEITEYVNYKYAKSIVRGLYSEDRFKSAFQNWVRMANNMPIIEESQHMHR